MSDELRQYARRSIRLKGYDYRGDSLQKLFEIQSLIGDIHPFLNRTFPVAIVEGGQFLIFDTDSSGTRYIFVKQAPTPMPIPQGVRAAFPLECYGGKAACVVTGDVFDLLEGYVTIFHEFIHCGQYEACEVKLKQSLGIARQAQAENDFMWELEYPFPYDAPRFNQLYLTLMEALERDQTGPVVEFHRQLKQILTTGEFEYMVWQEWKEGFARYIENRIRRRLELEENHRGREAPYTRVSFYEGGSKLVEFLEKQEPGLINDIETLFDRMIGKS